MFSNSSVNLRVYVFRSEFSVNSVVNFLLVKSELASSLSVITRTRVHHLNDQTKHSVLKQLVSILRYLQYVSWYDTWNSSPICFVLRIPKHPFCEYGKSLNLLVIIELLAFERIKDILCYLFLFITWVLEYISWSLYMIFEVFWRLFMIF